MDLAVCRKRHSGDQSWLLCTACEIVREGHEQEEKKNKNDNEEEEEKVEEEEERKKEKKYSGGKYNLPTLINNMLGLSELLGETNRNFKEKRERILNSHV